MGAGVVCVCVSVCLWVLWVLCVVGGRVLCAVAVRVVVVRALFCGGMTRHGVSPYSSVVEHPLSKRKVGSSILLGGISFCCSAQ